MYLWPLGLVVRTYQQKNLPHFQHFNSNFIYLSLVKKVENNEI